MLGVPQGLRAQVSGADVENTSDLMCLLLFALKCMVSALAVAAL